MKARHFQRQETAQFLANLEIIKKNLNAKVMGAFDETERGKYSIILHVWKHVGGNDWSPAHKEFIYRVGIPREFWQ